MVEAIFILFYIIYILILYIYKLILSFYKEIISIIFTKGKAITDSHYII